mmetsp:Transcript_83874/g.151327  ORF Transcript_83874/g.151327 Transcript_83874/m.151327 type:complete len:254 (-) Transcript_83874:351-1112(-)
MVAGQVKAMLVSAGIAVAVPAADIQKWSGKAGRRVRQVAAIDEVSITGEANNWWMSRDPAGVVGGPIETSVGGAAGGVLVAEGVAVKVRLAASLAHVVAAAVDLALLPRELGVVVEDREDGLAVDCHATARVGGEPIFRGTIHQIAQRARPSLNVVDTYVVRACSRAQICDRQREKEALAFSGIESGHASAFCVAPARRERNVVEVGREHRGLATSRDDEPLVVAVRIFDPSPDEHLVQEGLAADTSGLLSAG